MKLGAVHDAASLSYLRSPPGNRLEKLVGAEETWSIRVNQKWRIIFIWNGERAEEIRLDSHDYDI